VPLDSKEVLSKEDAIVAPRSVRNLRVISPFEGRPDWLVEKMVVGSTETSLLASPNCWITSDNPIVPGLPLGVTWGYSNSEECLLASEMALRCSLIPISMDIHSCLYQ
jgi:hypothetical protein